MKETLECFKG